jgi:hypothetical protein
MIEMQCGIRRDIHGKKRAGAVGTGNYNIKLYISTATY